MLNKEKCKFNQSSVNFVGHLIDQHGIRADPAKTAAILILEDEGHVKHNGAQTIHWDGEPIGEVYPSHC